MEGQLHRVTELEGKAIIFLINKKNVCVYILIWLTKHLIQIYIYTDILYIVYT